MEEEGREPMQEAGVWRGNFVARVLCVDDILYSAEMYSLCRMSHSTDEISSHGLNANQSQNRKL
jgi:hypothetical protein